MNATCRISSGDTWDVIVVGAGVAGTIASRELARQGHSVLLVEKSAFPRFKVCGGCLNMRALSILEQVGLPDLVGQMGGQPTKQIVMAAGGTSAVVPLPGGMSISRETLDEGLVLAAIDAGVEFLPSAKAQLGGADTDATREVVITLVDKRVALNASVVVIAEGLSGSLLSRATGVKPHVEESSYLGSGLVIDLDLDAYEPHRLQMAFGRAGYVGMVRVERNRLNIAAALAPDYVRESNGLGHAAERIIAEAGLPPIPSLAEYAWRGTPLLTRRSPTVAARRLFVVGDAAGYFEPCTGEGMVWAMRTGQAVSEWASLAIQGWKPEYIQRWQGFYKQQISNRSWICRGFSTVLRHSWLRQPVIRQLSRHPQWAAPVINRINQRFPSSSSRRGQFGSLPRVESSK